MLYFKRVRLKLENWLGHILFNSDYFIALCYGRGIRRQKLCRRKVNEGFLTSTNRPVSQILGYSFHETQFFKKFILGFLIFQQF